MKFKYNVTGSDRKRLVTAMAERLECPAKYKGAPTFAYEVDYFTMKDRKKQRENRKLKHKEEMIDKHNSFGNKDLTPFNAVLQMRTKDKAAIALK